jgi:hypothetical protein
MFTACPSVSLLLSEVLLPGNRQDREKLGSRLIFSSTLTYRHDNFRGNRPVFKDQFEVLMLLMGELLRWFLDRRVLLIGRQSASSDVVRQRPLGRNRSAPARGTRKLLGQATVLKTTITPGSKPRRPAGAHGGGKMSNSRVAVFAELSMGLVGPEDVIVPLMASLSYTCSDPYAVKMAFHVGADKPVEWILARDLLAAALHAREGIGDVRAWPSVAAPGPAARGGAAAGHRAGERILNISMTSPFGHAQFQAGAADIERFLQRTYNVVPEGRETAFLNFDAELTELLSQALRTCQLARA